VFLFGEDVITRIQLRLLDVQPTKHTQIHTPAALRHSDSV